MLFPPLSLRKLQGVPGAVARMKTKISISHSISVSHFTTAETRAGFNTVTAVQEQDSPGRKTDIDTERKWLRCERAYGALRRQEGGGAEGGKGQ